MIDFIGSPCFIGFIGDSCSDPVDKSALESLIEQALGLDEGGYTPATWSVLVSAVSDAQAVVDNDSSAQDDVDSAISDLQSAIDQLQPVADKTALNAEISRAQALNEDDFTPETWSVMTDNLDAAATVFVDPNASQLEVDDATADLKDAIDGLVPVDDV